MSLKKKTEGEIEQSDFGTDGFIPSSKKTCFNKAVVFTGINITNNIVGAGIITLPLAIKESGVGFGILLSAISAISCGWSFAVIAACGQYCDAKTYEKTVRELVGKVGYWVILLCRMLFPITVFIAYGVVIGDNLLSLASGIYPDNKFLEIRAILIFIPFFLIIFPLSIPKNIKFLEKVSALSLALIVFYVAVVAWRLFSISDQIQTLPNSFDFIKKTSIKTLPTYAFAFSCHHNALSFYYSMKERTIEKLLVAKNIAFFISYIIYIIVAGCGFVTFGGQPQQNLFVGYCSNDILINITRLVFTITILLTSPIQLHGCKEVIEIQFFSKYSKSKLVGPFITFVLVTVVFIISSLIDDVGTVIEVGGAITNVPLVYILPALCAIFMYRKNGYENVWKKIMAWTTLLFGLFMLVLSPYYSVQSYLEKSNHLPIEKYYCNSN